MPSRSPRTGILNLRGKARAGLLKTEKTVQQAANQFIKEYGVITEGQRSPRWVEGHKIRLRLHLLPFFGELGVSEVTAGKVQEYRVHRATTRRSAACVRKEIESQTPVYKAPARSTLHDEIVTLRLVLKTAIRHAWLDHLPDLSPPYRTQGKIVHRPWFSPEEYKQLYEATREYARKPFLAHHRWEAEQLHDFVLFLANTGLRPDEAKNLQHRDVMIVKDDATGETILEIEVRGKRGVGYCKSMPGAVRPYERLLRRALPGPSQTERARRRRGEDLSQPPPAAEIKYPEPTDPVFPGNHIKMFNNLLDAIEAQARSRRQAAHGLQPAPHLYLHAPHGRRRHLPDRQELPHQRRDDRAVLRRPHQEHARRGRPSISESRRQQPENGRRTHAPPRNAYRIGLGIPPEIPTVSSETFSFSPSAPLAGSANRVQPQIPVPKGTLIA